MPIHLVPNSNDRSIESSRLLHPLAQALNRVEFVLERMEYDLDLKEFAETHERKALDLYRNDMKERYHRDMSMFTSWVETAFLRFVLHLEELRLAIEAVNMNRDNKFHNAINWARVRETKKAFREKFADLPDVRNPAVHAGEIAIHAHRQHQRTAEGPAELGDIAEVAEGAKILIHGAMFGDKYQFSHPDKGLASIEISRSTLGFCRSCHQELVTACVETGKLRIF